MSAVSGPVLAVARAVSCCAACSQARTSANDVTHRRIGCRVRAHYAILRRVRELSGGRLAWTDGMLYPVLHRLERLGHVEARWAVAASGRRRKYYRITAWGRAQLAEERRQWQAVDATLRGLWQALALAVPAGHSASAAPRLLGA